LYGRLLNRHRSSQRICFFLSTGPCADELRNRPHKDLFPEGLAPQADGCNVAALARGIERKSKAKQKNRRVKDYEIGVSEKENHRLCEPVDR
jgi:hypothetical protein